MTELRDNVRQLLLSYRNAAGYWEGHLSSSALATATAIGAFATAREAGVAPADADRFIDNGLVWLIGTRNSDGGWGDTVDSASNISTTALVWAALSYGRMDGAADAAESARRWIHRAAGSDTPEALASALAARYGKDRTFSVPILTMCAIAGRLGPRGWSLIPQLPFELAALPRGFFASLRLPVVSYALPALIAMGLARHRRGPGLPLVSVLRSAAAPRVLRVLEGLQPSGGGFLEAVPLTAFVVMSLVAAGESRHPVVANGLGFLAERAREDGSWPIDTNLATWATTLSVDALSDPPAADGARAMQADERRAIRDWLFGQQWTETHPYTGAAPGGWAWTDLSGGVPDADDTAGAVLALHALDRDDPIAQQAAAAGIAWLLDLQNGDGGIPTFCRGWGALPFDRSATDLTAHAIRAWLTWRAIVGHDLRQRIDRGIARGITFLQRSQRAEGSFVPLWFGNQRATDEENPLYGTSRVLAALADVEAVDPSRVTPMLARAREWILRAQNADGSWGGAFGVDGTIEETALAVEALGRTWRLLPAEAAAPAARGLAWIDRVTSGGRNFTPSPIGLYFARLWYAEDLYPVIFTAAACEAAATLRRAAANP
jgi:squalene-hopene/tetraprenyl-beta-curcumene cyclase